MHYAVRIYDVDRPETGAIGVSTFATMAEARKAEAEYASRGYVAIVLDPGMADRLKAQAS